LQCFTCTSHHQYVGTLILLFLCRKGISEDYDESTMIENPLTDLSGPSVPHSATNYQVQYTVPPEPKSNVLHKQDDFVATEYSTEAPPNFSEVK